MHEVLRGVWHWSAEHPQIHTAVSCFWLEETAVLVDPLVPPDAGVEWFAARPAPPRAILLSNRHHYRDSGRFVEWFECTVHCNRTRIEHLDIVGRGHRGSHLVRRHHVAYVRGLEVEDARHRRSGGRLDGDAEVSA